MNDETRNETGIEGEQNEQGKTQQPDRVDTAKYEESIAKLKGALDKERAERQKLEKAVAKLLDILGDDDVETLRASEREAVSKLSVLEEQYREFEGTLSRLRD